MSVALTVRFYTLSQFSLVLNEDTKWLISKAPLSPATPLPSYREKIKTSINSGIKRSGPKLSPTITELLLVRIQMLSNLFSHLFENARLNSMGAEPTLQSSSLNGLSVPLLTVTLHPQWSAKAFFPHKMKRGGHRTGTALDCRHPSKSLLFEQPNDSFRKCMRAQHRGS